MCYNKIKSGGIMAIVESISMWGGLAGVVIAVFAIIILYLTRSNIVDLLDKDAIMYDKVYELKKNAFQNAFDVLDLYELYGIEVRSSKQFVQKAKASYNDLMCMSHNPKIYEEFYSLTLDTTNRQITVQNIADFKALCRQDLGLKNLKKKKKEVNTQLVGQRNGANQQKVLPSQSSARPQNPKPTPRPNDESD